MNTFNRVEGGLLCLTSSQESVDELDGDAHWDQDLRAPKAEPSKARRLKLRSRTGTRTGTGAEDGGRWFVHAALSVSLPTQCYSSHHRSL